MATPQHPNLSTRFWTTVKGTQLSDIIANGFFNYFSGITANGTQTLAAGARINYGWNQVDTSAVSGNAVTLRAAIPGRWCGIMNNGAQPIKVFPFASVDTINGGSAGASVTQNNAVAALYVCMKTGVWFRLLSA